MVIGWMVVGGLGGWLAGLALRGAGYGVVGDVILGVVGGVIGGLIAAIFDAGGPATPGGAAWSLVVAFAGALLLLPVMRVFNGDRRAARR